MFVTSKLVVDRIVDEEKKHRRNEVVVLADLPGDRVLHLGAEKFLSFLIMAVGSVKDPLVCFEMQPVPYGESEEGMFDTFVAADHREYVVQPMVRL